MLRPSVPRRLVPVVAATALVLSWVSGSPAQGKRAPGSASAATPDSAQLEKLATKSREDIAKYRATLGPVLAFFERELARLAADGRLEAAPAARLEDAIVALRAEIADKEP